MPLVQYFVVVQWHSSILCLWKDFLIDAKLAERDLLLNETVVDLSSMDYDDADADDADDDFDAADDVENDDEQTSTFW